MILQREIVEKSRAWGVPPDTVDKDYVLGQFLSAFMQKFSPDLIFKGGTCLRKCYIEGYRFSEDLDFTSHDNEFVIDAASLSEICQAASNHSGIIFQEETIGFLMHRDIPKGFQVKIAYWGANHSRNTQPTPTERWHTKIKLEISTDELMVTPIEKRTISHPYSDQLISNDPIPCYSIDEVVAEKLRSLKQRSYTAPRDFYDLFHLTTGYTATDWKRMKEILKPKMEHKNISYQSGADLVGEKDIEAALRAWDASIAHQVSAVVPEKTVLISTVVQRIQENL